MHHMLITRPASTATKYYPDQTDTPAFHRSHQIKARGADITGFNAVRAFVTAQQGVVIFVAVAFIFKGLGFKKLKIMGEILTDGDSKLCHITGGRFLF